LDWKNAQSLIEKNRNRLAKGLEHMGQSLTLMPAWEERNPPVAPYGCGAYGCAYPTEDRHVTFKITTDLTEALLADHFIERNWSWPGFCKIHLVVSFGIEVAPRVPVFGIWREAMSLVGLQAADYCMSRDEGEDALTNARLSAYYVARALTELSEAYSHSRFTPLFSEVFWDVVNRATAAGSLPMEDSKWQAWAKDLRDHLASYEKACDRMAGVKGLDEGVIRRSSVKRPLALVAAAMSGLFKEGVVLGDVHCQNLGIPVDRPSHLVVMETGIFLPLREELASADLPVIQFRA
jgi:hypothetical protein